MAGEYVFGEATDDDVRLRAQSAVLDPLTARLFDQAGLAPGMRVLDIGSGAGNVALLAAEAVGPRGGVVGIDRDPHVLERARRLAAGAPNVEFRTGDLRSTDGLDVLDGEFDAVVGRLVLAHTPDPVAALGAVTQWVRPGGLVCMHEGDLAHEWTSHATPLWEQVRGWLLEACAAADVDARMGPVLYATFRSAGLPEPDLVLEAPVGGGARTPTFGWSNSVRALLPVLERLGITSAEEAEVETLTERLDAEIVARNGTVLGPLMYGAWCTTPRAG
ncbi:class I SAM-dependent methyltransferase [Saccharopolyspora sp. HNM0983]|uniref:Class I SAM-dependent methyltransferase n=1 Tax=Saccharopolyspora montiporae TaxID=2781240 RepID=A0A929BBA5_9PSEU|nr:methyltransferase domain-containing protein [Saccharopolyspora sp. HNM0983]MBE9374523.1 class I SAM-dependent methyltransferase [Saccharopolyspora sp. HNM0983]